MTAQTFYTLQSPDIGAFKAEIDRSLDVSQVPTADQIDLNIPIYDGAKVRRILEDPTQRAALLAEWSTVLGDLSGVLVIKGVYPDHDVLDRATALFEDIIAREKTGTAGGGDHFAAAGNNDRIWNALQKLAVADPETFALYHARPEIDGVAEAWLGPGYQMTAQVNLVRPGGAAQTAHRDYHLGFMPRDRAVSYPARCHHLSPVLTLQGGIAHVDAPLDAGPTKLLPFSQTYGPGYLAYELDDFRALFEERAVQIPLEKGDTLFFNPALFHAAGDNKSADVNRLVNLVQISSAFGRAMETVDRGSMSKAVYPAVQKLLEGNRLNWAAVCATVAATAEGYAFPTNLDRDPPIGGLAPETQAELFLRGLDTGMAPTDFATAVDAQSARRNAVN